ncbi:hypothetical protein [Paenibacillus sp. CECT 9249]|nr:hypothetical protein [Paenibacillus sp. CECT 9249]
MRPAAGGPADRRLPDRYRTIHTCGRTTGGGRAVAGRSMRAIRLPRAER